MSRPSYNWTRLWRKIDLQATNQLGGSADPEDLHSSWWSWSRPYGPNRAVPYAEIADMPCLALLGEWGMGKSYTLKAAYDETVARLRETGGLALWRNLADYGSDLRLIHAIFEHPSFKQFVEDGSPLYLFLDSFDECLLEHIELVALFESEFSKYPRRNLYLRVACRTTEWPLELKGVLDSLWGADRVAAYELEPLEYRDIESAAQVAVPNPDGFLAEIERKDVQAFAVRPTTLQLLFEIYRIHGELPRTRSAIYQEGCRALCTEPSGPNIRIQRRGDRLTADQRVMIAARIAALTVLTNRSAIQITSGPLTDPSVCISLQQLWGGQETVRDNAFAVGEQEVREALTKGLFIKRGSDRMVWTQRSYAEFLAAGYLIKHQMPSPQVLELLVHPNDPGKKLVPLLRGTAAWLSEMDAEIFRALAPVEPEVLLQYGVEQADIEGRAVAVDTLLRLYNNGKLHPQRRDDRYYERFSHPGLADQLRAYIDDPAKTALARIVAIDFALACRMASLQQNLLAIALDVNQPYYVRVRATRALTQIGDDATKAQLKPLLAESQREKDDHDLLGWGLIALWPQHLAAAEVFALLTPPSQEDAYGGSYRNFLTKRLAEHLTLDDLPTALGWVEMQAVADPHDGHDIGHEFDELAQSILKHSWKYLDVHVIREAFAGAILARARQFSHRSLLPGAEEQNRRQVVTALLPHLTESDVTALAWSGVLLRQDFIWLVTQLLATPDDEQQRVLVEALWITFDKDDPAHLPAIQTAGETNLLLAQRFGAILQPDSPEAQKLRADDLALAEALQKNNQQTIEPAFILDPPLLTRIEQMLVRCESGKLDAWWQLNWWLAAEPVPPDRYTVDEFRSDLTQLPNWQVLDEDIQARIVIEASHYIQEQEPIPNRWIGTGEIYRPDFAGYRAFRLLLDKDPAQLGALPPITWQKWAPVLLAFPSWNETNIEPQQKLIQHAYQYGAASIRETLLRLIDLENPQQTYLTFLLSKVALCWDDELAAALLSKAQDPSLKPTNMGSLLQLLLEHGFAEGYRLAESLVMVPLPADEIAHQCAVVAAAVLLLEADSATWSAVWPAVQTEPTFGQEAFTTLTNITAPDGRNLAVLDRLSVGQLADLYFWLAQHYPPEKDYHHSGAVGAEYYIWGWRDACLRGLENKGTPAAVAALTDLATKLPTSWLVQEALYNAEVLVRDRTWTPPTPEEVLALVRDTQKHFVQNGEQLLGVVIETLVKLQHELRTQETPAATDLWNETNLSVLQQVAATEKLALPDLPEEAAIVYTPKSEGHLSDYVKRYLKRALEGRKIIVNREVQISSLERTDIHVDAVAGRDIVTVIIEVKGCWNRELLTSMRTQLAERYLKGGDCRHGVYLVGWFLCEHWTKADYRKRDAKRVDSLADLQRDLAEQATELSTQERQIKIYVLDASLGSIVKDPKHT